MYVEAPNLNPLATNTKLLEECIESIKGDITEKKAKIVTAASDLREASGKIPASDLKTPDHFQSLAMTGLGSNDFPNKLAAEVETYLRESKRLCERGLIPAILKCEGEVMENLSLLRSGINNEMELRFAVADPILKLLCSYWDLKVCGEVWGNYFCCRVLN